MIKEKINLEPQHNYCCSCDKFYELSFSRCPACKENSDFLKSYHLQKEDVVFTTGCFLRWDGEQFVLSDMCANVFFDKEYLQFDNDQQPYVIF